MPTASESPATMSGVPAFFPSCLQAQS